MIREHADEWKVDKELIFIHGLPRGGHLAASYGVFWNQEFMTSGLQTTAGALKVKGLLLSYPSSRLIRKYAHTGSFKNLLGDRFAEDRVQMSLEYQVTEAMPPCFIWHTAKDATVPVENSLLWRWRFKKQKCRLSFIYFRRGTWLSRADSLVERVDGEVVYKKNVHSGLTLQIRGFANSAVFADKVLKKVKKKKEKGAI